MTESQTNILVACITALVTVIGFIVTYFLNKHNFIEEVNKQKADISLDKIVDLPFKIQSLMDTILDKKNDETILATFNDLMISIFAYGSKDAITIATNMQELNYSRSSVPEGIDHNRVIAYYILLLCQVKFDLTDIKINPQYWFRMRLKDYTKIKSSLDNANNEIVDELGLQHFLRIKIS